MDILVGTVWIEVDRVDIGIVMAVAFEDDLATSLLEKRLFLVCVIMG